MSMKGFEPLQSNYEFEALNHYATKTTFLKRTLYIETLNYIRNFKRIIELN